MWAKKLRYTKFIQALPSAISPVIDSQKDLTFTKLDRLADELIPLINNVNAKALVTQQKKMQHRNKAYTDKQKHHTTMPIGLRPFTAILLQALKKPLESWYVIKQRI